MPRLLSALAIVWTLLVAPLGADTIAGPPPAQKILVITGSDSMNDFVTFINQTTAWYSCAADYNASGFLTEVQIHNQTVQTTVPPLATLQTYDQVWDLRFSAANCQGTVAACGTNGITPAQQADYLSYIAAGGSLFLMGDNGGYPGRNDPILAIANAVDSASAFSTSGVTTNNDTTQGAYINIAGATAAENFQSDYRDLTGSFRFIATQYNGLVPNHGAGYPILTDNLTGLATAVAFDCANMKTAYKAGKLMVAFDWQMMGGGGQVAYCGPPATTGTTIGYNERFWENSIDFLAPGSACSTPTDTATRTRTPTPTSTRTVTETSTDTPSRTVTPSSTNTVNPSPTSTHTATPTDSSTRTNTPSFTATVTQSFSSTATPTRTVTPSFTATITPSNTNTPGPTATYTGTRTVTPTQTSTVTQSYTFTATPSRTATPTFTPTITVSDTNTPGPTPTYTVTRSNTPSNTPTFSQTVTLTSTPSFSATPSDTATRSVTPTFTSTSTVTETSIYTPTDTPSCSPTPSITQTRTSTATPSDTRTVTDTFTQTPSATDSVTWSSTPTLSDTPTVTQTSTPSATRTVTPTQTVSFTASATPIPVPHKVKISLYNSAGELVKLLFDGGAQYLPGVLGVDEDVVPGGAGVLHIQFPGQLYDPALGGMVSSLAWAADNDAGQLVKTGVYTIKAEIVDNFGQVTTLQHSVQVIDVAAQNTLNIYNSAGEIVAELPLSSAGNGRYASLKLPSDSYGVQYDGQSGQLSGGLFAMDVTDEHGNSSTVYWDGRNAQGIPAASGSYIAELIYNAPGSGGTRVVESKSFVVIQAGESASLAGAFAAPNPALHGQDLVLFYPVSARYACVARLYTLAGELVSEAEDRDQSGQLRFSTGAVASGVYCAKLEKLSGGAVAARTTVKVAIVR